MVDESIGDLLTRYAKVVKIEIDYSCLPVSYDSYINSLKKTTFSDLQIRSGSFIFYFSYLNFFNRAAINMIFKY